MIQILHSHPRIPGLQTLLKQRSGPLPSELLLRPNDFGLGMLPRNLETDAITTSVCRFCSTGCQLKVHLHEGEATGLTPSPDYPVNLGMACPKGWESLAVLDSPDRAITPLLRGKEISWQEAAETFTSEFKKNPSRARQGIRRLHLNGPNRDRRNDLSRGLH